MPRPERQASGAAKSAVGRFRREEYPDAPNTGINATLHGIDQEYSMKKVGNPPPFAGSRRWASLAFLCLAVVVIVMDGSIVNVALPTLAVRLAGATTSGLQWIVDAYILAFAALLLTMGNAADRFGRRRVLLLGLFVFAAFSVGAALSDGCGELIAWRTCMGFGAAMIFPSTLAIITEEFPEPELRKTAIAIWAGSSGLGVAIGPVAGGWLLEHLPWGAIFLVNLPIVLVATAGVMLFVRESRDPHRPSFDAVGCALAILAILSLVWGLIEAPERGWTTWSTLASLSGAVVLLAGFVAWERSRAEPMLDVRYFLDRRFSGSCVAIAAAFFGLFGFVFMVTQFFQFLHRYSALSAGIRTLPFAGFILLGAMGAAWAGRRTSSRVIISVGLVLMSAGFAWATGESLRTPYSVMVLQMGLLGIGLGLVNAAATEVVMTTLPLRKAGTGSSINDTLREVGGTLGVAGMGSAFNALYRGRMADVLDAAPLPETAKTQVMASIGAANEVIDRIEAIAGVHAANSLRGPVQEAFLRGFHASCWIASGAALLGAAAVLVAIPRITANSAEK